MEYGLVFKAHDKIFLAKYDESGNINDGDEIEDLKGIYDKMTANEVSFVEIRRYQQDVGYLKDLKVISVKDDADATKTFLNFLEEGGGPEFAKMVYEDIIGHVA